jgi:hypothetical protein
MSSIETVAPTPPVDLSSIEAQVHTHKTSLVRKQDKECISDICCAKIVLISITTLVMVPFAICDVYFGTLDNTCLSQSQYEHNLAITMKTYLLSSGIIEFILYGFIALLALCFDTQVSDTDALEVFGACTKYILYLFGTAWLVLGCVLFWAYTDISQCSANIHDYMFARLILGIVGICGRGASSQEDKKRGPY